MGRDGAGGPGAAQGSLSLLPVGLLCALPSKYGRICSAQVGLPLLHSLQPAYGWT